MILKHQKTREEKRGGGRRERKKGGRRMAEAERKKRFEADGILDSLERKLWNDLKVCARPLGP